MTEQESQTLLTQTRDSFLAKMQEKGFWYLSPWDINNGLCEDFAEEISKLVPTAEVVDIVRFEGTEDEDSNNDLLLEYAHFWILWNGKHYDAEYIEGVVNHRDLPFFNPKGNPRPNSSKIESARDKKIHSLQWITKQGFQSEPKPSAVSYGS
jgi:hypothetical protein